MNWKQHILKPKWKNKSADIRLESVSSEQDPELISSLLEIARDDEDVRVRCAAIKRLHMLENILKLYAVEKDSAAKTLLEERIHQLASSTSESRPPVELRIQVAENTTDRDLIEHLARNAPEKELRRTALARVERQGVLGDCCINDDDTENRRYAAGRISQHTTLKRVIDALRKRDKALYTELQARLHAELLEQKDPAAVKTEALQICVALEKLALEGEEEPARVPVLHAAWKKIAGHTDDELTARYQRICSRLSEQPPDPVPVVSETTAEASDEEPGKEPEQESEEQAAPDADQASQTDEELVRAADDIALYRQENPDRPHTASLKKLVNQLDKAWRQCDQKQSENLANHTAAMATVQELEGQIGQIKEQLGKELEQAQALLTKLEDELEQGKLHDALQTRAKLQQMGKGHGKSRDWQQINRKMSGMHARLRELREWHHWSNNKIRKRLIAEMEVLPSADLHPDALLDRIKSLQKEWKDLEHSEQIPGEKHFAAAPWMWRKFSAAGHTAFDTVKPYLDKRSEIQSRHAQSLATFCAELEQLAQAEPKDWTALGRGLNRGRKKLHELNSVPARQRHKLARKLKKALDAANAVIQEHYEAVEVEKMKLIRAASQLVHLAERSEAITQAKSLQSQWKDAGSLWRSREQKLWNEFRSHLDPLFSELKEEQDSLRAADEEKLTAQRDLCKALQDILGSKDDLATQNGKVRGLQGSWNEIRYPDRKLQKKFQDLLAEYKQKLKQMEQQLAAAEHDRLWLKFSLLHELAVTGRTTKGAISKKTETKVNKTWPADSSGEEPETSLDKACKDLLDGKTPGPDPEAIEDMQKRARGLCIRLEFLAGLASPEEDREQRMKYQVDRLAGSMSGEITRQPVSEEAADAEREWLTMYALPEQEFSAYGARIKQALSNIRG